MQWLKKTEHGRKDLYNDEWYRKWILGNNGMELPPDNDDDMCSDSRAQRSMLRYMENYKALVHRNSGNELKIPKFHLMKHIVRNICRNGAVPNIDGSRQESNAKQLAKCPGLRTQKQHRTICIQSAFRYHEDLTILEAERLFYMKLFVEKRNEYSYFNPKQDAIERDSNEENGHCINEDETVSQMQYFKGSNFYLSLMHAEETDTMQQVVARVTLNGKGIKSRINDNLLHSIVNWLWIDPIGGTISRSSTPRCFTELRLNNTTYRCHPSYRSNNECWHDWVLINWGTDFKESVPARLHLFLSTEDCEVISEKDSINIKLGKNEETDYALLPIHSRDDHNLATNFLSLHKQWAIVHSADDSIYLDSHDDTTSYHLSSKISRRIKLEENVYRIVPVEYIVGQVFGMVNYTNIQNDTLHDNTAIIVDHPSTWAKHFLLDENEDYPEDDVNNGTLTAI